MSTGETSLYAPALLSSSDSFYYTGTMRKSADFYDRHGCVSGKICTNCCNRNACRMFRGAVFIKLMSYFDASNVSTIDNASVCVSMFLVGVSGFV